MNELYRPRVIDEFIEKRLQSTGAMLIQGSKGCGKTTTAKRFSKSFVQIIDSRNPGILEMARTSPADILSGESPRLIDEWQFAPRIWDAVRDEIDERGAAGQFILTGSSVPPEGGFFHSGVGRISRVIMRPMSLYESGESNGKVSLKALFNEIPPKLATSGLMLKDISELMVRGGWPFAVNMGVRDGTYAEDYIESVIESEISRADGIKHDTDSVRKVMRSLARNTSTMASVSTIVKNVASDEGSVSDKTVKAYLGCTFIYFHYRRHTCMESINTFCNCYPHIS